MNAVSASTVQTYQHTWKQFQNFAREIKVDQILPANPGVIVLYISHLFKSGLASSTIFSKLSAISYVHKIHGWDDPAENFLRIRI